MTTIQNQTPQSISNLPKSNTANIVAATIIVALCLLPELAFAQSGSSGSNPVLAFLNGVVAFLNTGVMRAIAILAVFSLGVLCYLGKLTFGMTATICGGIILTFGAASLVDQFSAFVPGGTLSS